MILILFLQSRSFILTTFLPHTHILKLPSAKQNDLFNFDIDIFVNFHFDATVQQEEFLSKKTF